MDSAQFHFINFTPSEFIYRFAQQNLNEILDLAPYDASSEATVERREDGSYACKIGIFSFRFQDVGEAEGVNPMGVIQTAVSDIQKKLNEWHHHCWHATRQIS